MLKWLIINIGWFFVPSHKKGEFILYLKKKYFPPINIDKPFKFYKESNGRWYVDMPQYIDFGGKKEDLEMVAGADIWLDIISEGETEIYISLSKNKKPNYEVIKLIATDYANPLLGGYYSIKSYKSIPYDEMIWLCSVTLFVFGEYPQEIFYYVNR